MRTPERTEVERRETDLRATERREAERKAAERGEEETPVAAALAEADMAAERAKNEAGDNKLSDAEIAAVEEDALRRRYSAPQKEATSAPPVSANQPPRPTFEEVMADLKFPASKDDLVMRARLRGLHLDERYQLEKIEDRLYVDMEQVHAAMRAAPL